MAVGGGDEKSKKKIEKRGNLGKRGKKEKPVLKRGI